MNKKFLLCSLVIFLGLFLVVFQCVKEMQADLVSAAASRPANGHLWADMECNSDTLCLSNSKVGIGTDNSGYKLDVQGGQINASGGLCIAGDCRASWSLVGGDDDWKVSANNLYNFNTGNVGIGTSSPSQKLEVAGNVRVVGNIGATGSVQSSGSITATGKVSSSDDVCISSGACLSQLNSFVGAQNLVSSNHTFNMCNTTADSSGFGEVVNVGTVQNPVWICKFDLASCPVGQNSQLNWIQYQNYSTTTANISITCTSGFWCYADGDGSSCSGPYSRVVTCRPADHLFANLAVESRTGCNDTCVWPYSQCWLNSNGCTPSGASSLRTQIGCY